MWFWCVDYYIVCVWHYVFLTLFWFDIVWILYRFGFNAIFDLMFIYESLRKFLFCVHYWTVLNLVLVTCYHCWTVLNLVLATCYYFWTVLEQVLATCYHCQIIWILAESCRHILFFQNPDGFKPTSTTWVWDQLQVAHGTSDHQAERAAVWGLWGQSSTRSSRGQLGWLPRACTQWGYFFSHLLNLCVDFG